MLSTVGMLRGLERVGVIPSPDAVIYEMTHPSKPDRRPAGTRVFTDLPKTSTGKIQKYKLREQAKLVA